MKFGVILTAQWRSLVRHGLPQVYGILLAVFAALLRFAPEGARQTLAFLFTLTDSMLLGYFLMGALVLLEKKQGTEIALCIVPGGISRVFLARTVIFSAFAAFALFALSIAAGISFVRFAVALIPVILGASLFTALGSSIALRVRTLNAFMILAGVSMVPCLAGLLAFAKANHPLLWISPSWGVAVAVGSNAPGAWLIGVVHSIAWYVLALVVLSRSVLASARMEA